MKINLEILDAATVYAKEEIVDLRTKELVPKMLTRRRLTRAAKIAIYLANEVDFTKGRIIYGSSFGELPTTANILNAIHAQEGISPTQFQNSVYNTAVSYLSMLHQNEEEILTISSGELTSQKVLKSAAVKALKGDTLLLLVTETLHIEKIEEVNNCVAFLECGVALKVRLAQEPSTVTNTPLQRRKGLPSSVQYMFGLAKSFSTNKKNIIEVTL